MGYWSHQLYQYSLQAVWTADVCLLLYVSMRTFCLHISRQSWCLVYHTETLLCIYVYSHMTFELTGFGVTNSSFTSLIKILHTSLQLQVESP